MSKFYLNELDHECRVISGGFLYRFPALSVTEVSDDATKDSNFGRQAESVGLREVSAKEAENAPNLVRATSEVSNDLSRELPVHAAEEKLQQQAKDGNEEAQAQVAEGVDQKSTSTTKAEAEKSSSKK